LRCTGQNNQLTAINAHVGYVLFTVVMTTFTVAPSSGVPYADALLRSETVKKLLKLDSISQSYAQMEKGHFFMSYSEDINCTVSISR